MIYPNKPPRILQSPTRGYQYVLHLDRRFSKGRGSREAALPKEVRVMGHTHDANLPALCIIAV